MKQVVTRYGCPLNCGDRATRDTWFERAEHARRTQRVPFAVAPRVQLRLPSGRTLLEGEAVVEENFSGGELPAYTLLQRALQEGRVLERYVERAKAA